MKQCRFDHECGGEGEITVTETDNFKTDDKFRVTLLMYNLSQRKIDTWLLRGRKVSCERSSLGVTPKGDGWRIPREFDGQTRLGDENESSGESTV